jgi:hypothetical protein
MQIDEAVFLLLVLGGVTALVSSILRARLHWRPDIPPYRRRTRSFDVLRHPERYADGSKVPGIRTLSRLGALAIVMALAVLASKACRDFIR